MQQALETSGALTDRDRGLGFLSFEFAQLARAVVGLATGQNKPALELDVIDC